MQKSIKKPRLLGVSLLSGLITALVGLCYSGIASADSVVTLSQISANIDGAVVQLATVLTDVSLITGIGFVMASFFKFHQHKLNPTQVPLSQGMVLLAVGVALTLVPVVVPTATKTIFGKDKTEQVGGSDIINLIGTGNSK